MPGRRARRVSVRPISVRAVGSRLLPIAAMTFAGALAVGMSVPANAFGPVASAVAETSAARSVEAGQSVVVETDAAAPASGRDDYTVTSWAEILKEKYGSADYTYTVGTGSIRWPFPFAVPIGSGFGARVAPCATCSTIHNGVDFLPGEGAPIYSIADGIVSAVADSGAYGYHVYIDHVINGQKVQSLYAHIQRGSVPLTQGQAIKVGEFIGLVGSTGQATGPHLHFEIAVDGTRVDPFAWLKANAN